MPWSNLAWLARGGGHTPSRAGGDLCPRLAAKTARPKEDNLPCVDLYGMSEAQLERLHAGLAESAAMDKHRPRGGG